MFVNVNNIKDKKPILIDIVGNISKFLFTSFSANIHKKLTKI
jgi:hypothetical protein